MENDLEVRTRPYQPGDENQLSAILESIYRQKFNDQYWRWKYLDNPLQDHYCYCALMDDQIVGFAGGIPYRVKWRDREIVGGQLTDLAVQPGLKGKKVFSPLQRLSMAAIFERADIVYGFTNESSFRIYYKKYPDWDYAFHVPRMIKILNTAPLLKKKVSWDIPAKIVGGLADFGLGLAERVRGRRYVSDVGIVEMQAFDHRFDRLMTSLSPRFNLMHVRDQRYLQWRYSHHPLYRYTLYAAIKEDNVLGFVVLRDEPAAVHRGFILEFLAPPERVDIQHLLLQKAIAHFRDRGVDIIICWMFRHSPYHPVFKRHLFVDRRGDLIVLATVCKKNDELKKDLNDPLSWYIACGDDESF